jgi:hypothetical protein
MSASSKTFYLGTHQPHWLRLTSVPLFVSRMRLAGVKKLPRAIGRWALDSGGFSQIAMHGRFTVSAANYAAEVRRFRDEIGRMEWAAPQDWMCEPAMIERTGLSVAEHQRRTIASYLDLQALAPDLPWIPVLQGWGASEYFSHVEQYQRAGVDLGVLPLVGVGSVCRRQSGITAGIIFHGLKNFYGLRLHGFGVKKTGLLTNSESLVSADSMAWSFAARREPPIPGHPHQNCANCLDFALLWRETMPDLWLQP